MLWITRLNDIGQRPSISLLKRFVNYILVNRYIDPTKPPYTYGTKWAIRFCKRRKIILKTKVPKEVKRQAAKDPVLIKEWFNALGKDIKKYAVQYKDIYNIDEFGIRIQWGVISVRAQATPNVIFFAKLLRSNHKINSMALKQL